MRNFFPITALLKNIAEMIHVINYIQLVNDNLIELNQNKSDPKTTKFTDACHRWTCTTTVCRKIFRGSLIVDRFHCSTAFTVGVTDYGN